MQKPSLRIRSMKLTLCKAFGEMICPNFLSFVWRCHFGSHQDEHQRVDRKPTETSVTQFYNQSEIQ